MSLILNGVDQHAEYFLTDSFLSDGVDQSIFCWVKSTQTLTPATVFGIHANGQGYGMAAIRRDSDDFIDTRFRPTSTELVATSTEKVTSVYKKTLLVWQDSTDTLTVYVDESSPVSVSGAVAHQHLRILSIGCQFGGADGATPNSFFGGSIAHAAFWKDTALTGADLTDLMSGALKPIELSVAPTHYKPFVNDQSGGIGTDYTLLNSPTIDSDDPYIAGPSITNIDIDNDVYPNQTAIIAMSEGADTATSVTLGDSVCTFTGTATTTERPVIIPINLPYGTHELLVDGTISLSNVALSPSTDKQFVTVANVNLTDDSVFYNSSPAVANGDQWELPLLTDQGNAITPDPSGTVQVSNTGLEVQTAQFRVYDMDVGAWSNMPTATIMPIASGDPINTAPVIVLDGDNPLTLIQGTPYIEPGYTATDAESGVITNDVSITNGTIDENTIQSNTITYTVTDGELSTSETRIVNVVAVPDTVAPVITDPNNLNVSIPFGDIELSRDHVLVQQWLSQVSASDDIAGQVAVAHNIPLSMLLADSPIAVTFSATDGTNSSTLIRNINISEAPAASAAPMVAAGRVDAFEQKRGAWHRVES